MECKKQLISETDFKRIARGVIDERRKNQLRSSWLKNVVRIQGVTIEEALVAYDKIKPYG